MWTFYIERREEKIQAILCLFSFLYETDSKTDLKWCATKLITDPSEEVLKVSSFQCSKYEDSKVSLFREWEYQSV
jgi:hypothetical protein